MAEKGVRSSQAISMTRLMVSELSSGSFMQGRGVLCKPCRACHRRLPWDQRLKILSDGCISALLFSFNRPKKAKDLEFAALTVGYGAPMTPAPSPLTFKEADILHFKPRLVYENIMYKYFIKRISPQEVR